MCGIIFRMCSNSLFIFRIVSAPSIRSSSYFLQAMSYVWIRFHYSAQQNLIFHPHYTAPLNLRISRFSYTRSYSFRKPLICGRIFRICSNSLFIFRIANAPSIFSSLYFLQVISIRSRTPSIFLMSINNSCGTSLSSTMSVSIFVLI